MVDQSGRDLVLLKQLIDAVIELVGNERKTKNLCSFSCTLRRCCGWPLTIQCLGYPLFCSFVAIRLNESSLYSAVAVTPARLISFWTMAFFTNVGWWELKFKTIPLFAAFVKSLRWKWPVSSIWTAMSRIGRKPSSSDGSSISNFMVGCLLLRYSSMLFACSRSLTTSST